MEQADRTVTVMVTPSLRKKLEKLAKANGRSLSGEARFALTRYTDKGGKA